MLKKYEIENALLASEPGSFQKVCNEILALQDYIPYKYTGSEVGTNKTTRNTPDSVFCDKNNNFVYVEIATVKKERLLGKVNDDVDKCLKKIDENPILKGHVVKILYFHNRKNIEEHERLKIQEKCNDIVFEIYGIDYISTLLLNSFPQVAKSEYNLREDTCFDDNINYMDRIADTSNANIFSEESNKIVNDDVKYRLINFPNLGNYLVNYLNDEKQPGLLDKTDICMKEILDWFVGIKKFPTDKVRLLYYYFDNSKLKINEKYLNFRREALIEYYSGTLDESIKEYDDNLDVVLNDKLLKDWFKNDFLIDGRNLTISINPLNRWKENNRYQKIMDENDIFVTYPIIDRLEKTILNKTLDGTFTNDFKRRGTQIFGFGAPDVFLNIQRIIYTSILYGSITQLNVVRNLIGRVCIEYAKSFDDEDLYLKGLKFYVLNGKYREYKNISTKISCKFESIESNKFVKEILSLRNSIIPHTRSEFDIFIFNQFGRLLSDKEFDIYEKRIIRLLSSKESAYKFDALSSLHSNLERISDKDKLFQVLLKLSKCGYSREVQTVLSFINYEGLTKEHKTVIKEIISIIVNAKEYYIDILSLLIEIKRIEGTTEYDEILLKDNSYENLAYQIESNSDYNVNELELIIDDLSRKYNNIFKTGVISSGLGEFYISSKYFEEKSKILDDLIECKILPLAEQSLKHKLIKYREKIKMLKTLLYIYYYDSKYIIQIKNIISNICATADEDWFEEEYDKRYLEIYLNALKFAIGEISINELLRGYVLMCHEKYFIEDISYILNYLSEKVLLTDDNYIFISLLSEIALSSDITEHVMSGIRLSKVLYCSKYFNNIYAILVEKSKKCNFQVANALINLLLNISDKKFDVIKDNLLNSNNYNIRYMTRIHLNK